MHSQKFIWLEILVDRNNEKGVFVASQVLVTLHSLAEEHHHWYQIRRHPIPTFHFEVLHEGGRIRFFMMCEKKYRNFLESQLYAHYPNIEIQESNDPLSQNQQFLVCEPELAHFDNHTIKLYTNLKDRTEKESVDPLSSITSSLSKLSKSDTALYHIAFTPLSDHNWREGTKGGVLASPLPDFLKRWFLLGKWYTKVLLWPLYFFFRIIGLFRTSETHTDEEGNSHEISDKKNKDNERTSTFGYQIAVRIAKNTTDPVHDKHILKEITGSLSIFANAHGSRFVVKRYREFTLEQLRIPHKGKDILNAAELAGLVHMPTIYIKTPGINWVMTRTFEPPHNLPNTQAPNIPLGVSNFRGSKNEFGIQPIDRARHTYIIGKTGMGKSTLLENMIYADILAGNGVGLIDPHGDLAETILANIPKSRTNDIVLFDPSDRDFPIGFNMFDMSNPELRVIVGSGLVSIFKKMFSESWGPRLEYILRNTILTLLSVPDSTLVSIPLLLTHESFRRKVVAKLEDPILVQFWTQEFEKMTPSMMSEAINPILNKVGQFLSSPLLRNILGQVKNPFSMRWVMDNKKIFIINLSKGKIGEDASALLGAMMVTKFQIDAMTRADIPEKDRKDFYLYVDEFQNFATDSFGTILSEARKYKLSLTMANQYIAQMPETVRDAVFGNVGTLISFQVGFDDAKALGDVFGGEEVILPADLTNLRKYDIYTKLLIDGMPSPVFSATTFAPIHSRIDTPNEQSRDVILKVSREKYTKKREFVEKKIFEYAKKIREEEVEYRKKAEAYKEKVKEEKEKKRLEEKSKEKKESS